MAKWSNLAGTLLGYIRIGLNGVRLKNSSGNLLVRNANDSADAVVLPQSLGTGTRDGSKSLRDDGTWRPPVTANRISEPLTIEDETSYVVIDKLILDDTLTVDGKVRVLG
jgi:hypothetical protein